jgi:hypothetical protein
MQFGISLKTKQKHQKIEGSPAFEHSQRLVVVDVPDFHAARSVVYANDALHFTRREDTIKIFLVFKRFKFNENNEICLCL